MSGKKAAAPIWTAQASPNTTGSSQPGSKRFVLSKFIWNPETHEFLGRTALSWFKITVFYICFYAGLASFFLASLKVALLINIDDAYPKWTLDESLITSNPGVGFRPLPDQNSNVESTLIWINREVEVDGSYWVEELKRFLAEYSGNTGGKFCDYDSPATGETPCIVDIEKVLECNHTNNWGYTSGLGKVRPCVLVKLNRIYNWKPEPYATRADLEVAKSRNMPQHLVERIEGLIERADKNDTTAERELKTVWISCEGENPADVEFLGGPHHVKYFAPGFDHEFPGIPTYYFPYLNQADYMSPFVFVKFEELEDNVLINIRCKAWAKNIIAEVQDRKGMVHFEFFITGKTGNRNLGSQSE